LRENLNVVSKSIENILGASKEVVLKASAEKTKSMFIYDDKSHNKSFEMQQR